MVIRHRFWIDDQVQGVLIGRIVLYWFFAVLYFGCSAACYQWWANPELSYFEHAQTLFEQAWPSIPSILLLLPLVLVDIVRLSNRFAGPIYRVRNHLGRVLQDSRTYPLSFRDGDYWQCLAAPINTLQERIVALEDEVARVKAEADAQSAISSAERYVAQQRDDTEAHREREDATSEAPARKTGPTSAETNQAVPAFEATTPPTPPAPIAVTDQPAVPVTATV